MMYRDDSLERVKRLATVTGALAPPSDMFSPTPPSIYFPSDATAGATVTAARARGRALMLQCNLPPPLDRPQAPAAGPDVRGVAQCWTT